MMAPLVFRKRKGDIVTPAPRAASDIRELESS
jgi:hypothetical protein